MRCVLMGFLILFIACKKPDIAAIIPDPVETVDTSVNGYFQRIRTAGSGISDDDQAAIIAFEGSAREHGYWQHLLDVGPFAGNDLKAALIKLKAAPGSSYTITNRGFSGADYSRSQGLQGAEGKTLITGVNLATVNGGLKGLGGMAFYSTYPSTGGVTTAIGLPNNADPYTLLVTGAGAVAYWGTGAATINPKFGFDGAGPEGFYHTIRQSPGSTKVLFNGEIQSTANAVSNTSRNGNLELFMGSTLSGGFYAIDDGQLTDEQCKVFFEDVSKLMTSLGRKNNLSTPLNYSLLIGQSLAYGTGGSPALNTTQPYNNKQLKGGSLNAFVPLVETGLETIASSTANAVSETVRKATDRNNSTQDIAINNFSVGSARYADLKKGTDPYNKSIAAVRAAQKTACSQYGTSLQVPALLVVHGESDLGDQQYGAYMKEWRSDYEKDINAITGRSDVIKMFHSQSSSWTIVNTPGGHFSPIILEELHEADTNQVLVCPKYFLQYNEDGQHLINTSYRKLGEYYAKAWHKTIVLHQRYEPLRPTSTTLNGNAIDITFTGNVGNLVLDENLVSNPGSYGFEYADDAGSATITGVTVTGANTVRVVLNTTPTGANKHIRYAYTGIPGNKGGPASGARGNLRDSDPAVSMYTGERLYNWCVHFDKLLSTH